MASDNTSYTQPSLFPDHLPAVVLNYWDAIAKYHRTQTRREPTLDEIAKRMDIGVSTLYRARKKHPDLMPWPVARGQRPPWEPTPEPEPIAPEPLNLVPLDLQPELRLVTRDEDGQEHMLPVVVDQQGLVRVVSHTRTLVVATATLATPVLWRVLDFVSDGRVDGAVKWCHLAARLLARAG